jgi:hypothetical protein
MRPLRPREEVRTRAEVISRDGRYLGCVKAVVGLYFHVDAPMQPDYWLSMDTIATVSPTRITLNVHADRVGEFARAGPRPA